LPHPMMPPACRCLHDAGQPALVREIIAKRVIEAAKKGERDPVRLRNAGLAPSEIRQGSELRGVTFQTPVRRRLVSLICGVELGLALPTAIGRLQQ
jgi:hypothetical protein